MNILCPNNCVDRSCDLIVDKTTIRFFCEKCLFFAMIIVHPYNKSEYNKYYMRSINILKLNKASRNNFNININGSLYLSSEELMKDFSYKEMKIFTESSTFVIQDNFVKSGDFHSRIYIDDYNNFRKFSTFIQDALNFYNKVLIDYIGNTHLM